MKQIEIKYFSLKWLWKTKILQNILLVFLTEKCMPKEHKNVEFKNAPTEVSNL